MRDQPPSEPYRALLDVTEAIAAHASLADLANELAHRLNPFVGSEFVLLTLHDAATDRMHVRILGGKGAKVRRSDEGLPIEASAGGEVWRTQRPLLIPDTAAETRFPQAMERLREGGVASVWYLPLTTARQRLGAIGFASSRPGAPTAADVELLAHVAKQVAVAVESAMSNERAERFRSELTAERDRLRLLLEVNDAVVANLDLRKLMHAVTDRLQRAFGYEYTSLGLHDPETDAIRFHAFHFADGRSFLREGAAVRVDDSPSGRAFTTGKPFVARNLAELGAFGNEPLRKLVAEGVRSTCSIPLTVHGRRLGILNAGSLHEEAFDAAAVDLLVQVASQIAPAVANALAYREIEELKDKLAKEKTYLEGEIRASFSEIVGPSASLARVLKEVETVATTDSTVLITGETGTGKELIARAIHNLSGRRERTFVKINCAAIPTGLLESELFGHEKGAFTGAVAQKVGRFELAHQGTLFLDEVGDIPPELQPKLLRVLQEQEFERLGGTRTIRVSVRLVAATNRDLAQMVADRTFRSDLFYRLNVFPVTIPPLRERREDIPHLVRHFVAKNARRMSRRIDTIPSEVIDALTSYPWPGNVRELENLIERSVILSPGPTLHVPLAELRIASAAPPGGAPPALAPGSGARLTLVEAERELILDALRETAWVLGGPAGAAARLGMKRTTLQSKMQKLGIERPG